MRTRYFFYLLAFIFLFSCEQHHVRRNLVEAEKLLLSDPDSALTILNSVCEEDLSTNKLKAQHCLLAIMAKDKCMLDVVDESSAVFAYDWYRRQGNTTKRLWSCYYLGVVFQNENKDIDAVLAFREAEPLAESLQDYRQLCLIYQHLCAIFGNNFDYVNALEYARKSLSAAIKAEEPLMAEYCRYDVAEQLISASRYQEAEALLNQILKSNKTNDALYSLAAKKKAEICCYKTNYDNDLVKFYYNEVQERGIIPLGSHDYGILATVYEDEGDSVKANKYLKEACSLLETSLDSAIYYNDCRNVYDRRKDWEKAHNAKTRSSLIQNKIVVELLGQSLIHTTEKYYMGQLEKERLLFKARIYLFIIILIVIVVIVSLIVVIHRNRNQKILDDLTKVQDISSELLNTLIADKVKVLQKLSESYCALDDKEVIKREKREGILTREEIIKKYCSELSELRRDQDFIRILEQSLNVREDDLMSNVRQLFPDYKELDFRILTLLFSGFSIKSISFLFKMSEASLRMRKTRYKHHFESLPNNQGMRFIEMM